MILKRKDFTIQRLLYWCYARFLPELGEFWLPRDDVRGGWGPVGGLPFRGLPGGNVSGIDMKLAFGVFRDVVIDDSPSETAGIVIVAG